MYLRTWGAAKPITDIISLNAGKKQPSGTGINGELERAETTFDSMKSPDVAVLRIKGPIEEFEFIFKVLQKAFEIVVKSEA